MADVNRRQALLGMLGLAAVPVVALTTAEYPRIVCHKPLSAETVAILRKMIDDQKSAAERTAAIAQTIREITADLEEINRRLKGDG